ncbi:hypothetical protein JCM10212_004834 [Sporobolomyces blumeae]
MDSIHSSHPSSARGPPQPQDDSPSSRLERLTNARTLLLAQLDHEYSILRLNNNSTMHTPLVDPEGFPRSDIDVASVRTARVKIIRLRNDLNDLERDLERVVHEALARNPDEQPQPADHEPKVETSAHESAAAPFARVDAVAPSSPAAAAGLQRDDLILAFASVNASNHDKLRAVGLVVSQSEGTELAVEVKRGAETRELKLVPRSGWGGRGSLGCHIVPYP